MKNFLISNLSSTVVNFALLTFLLIGMQNNHSTKKVSFLNYETIQMPLGFISGSSFIIGSLTGNLVYSILKYK
tara:strand:- start:588 stop:806 length:219 start_codon:yes stop_codon:yes gene_type:complete